MTTKFTNSEGLFKHLDAGHLAEVTEEIFDYFMEILPPINFTGSSFILREGDGESYKFTNYGKTCYARLVKGSVLTKDYMVCMYYEWVHPSLNSDDTAGYRILVCIDELNFLKQYQFALVSDLKKIADLYSENRLNPETFLADANIVSYIHLPKAQ